MATKVDSARRSAATETQGEGAAAVPPQLREKLDGAPHSKLSVRLWLRLLSCVMVVEKQVRRQMVEQFDSTLPRFDVMSALERRRDGMVMRELSSSLLVSSGNVTGVVDRLIADGLASREIDPDDRRSIIVKLTPKGLRDFNKMASVHEQWFDNLFANLPDSRILDLLDSLAQVRAEIDRQLPRLDDPPAKPAKPLKGSAARKATGTRRRSK